MQTEIKALSSEQKKIEASTAYSLEELKQKVDAKTYIDLNQKVNLSPSTAHRVQKRGGLFYVHDETGEIFTVRIETIGG